MSVRLRYSVLIGGKPVLTNCSRATANSVYQAFSNHFINLLSCVDSSVVDLVYPSIVVAFEPNNKSDSVEGGFLSV